MRIAVFFSLFLALAAQAEETPRGAARSHSKTGEDFFKQGRFAEARVEFEAAFALSQEPDLLFNVAKSYEREGSIKEALGAYDRYLALRRDDTETAARVQRMRESLAPAAPILPAPPVSSQRSPWRIVGIAALSVGVAFLGASLGTGIATELDRQSLAGGTLTYSQAMTTADRASKTRAAAFACGSVGAALVITGIPLLVWR